MDKEEKRRQRDQGARDSGTGLEVLQSIIRGPGSAARKRALIREALLLEPDAYDREIAYQVGCDHKTVGTVRHAMELAGEIPILVHPRDLVVGRPPISETLAQHLLRAVERYEARWGQLYADEMAKALRLLGERCVRPPSSGGVKVGNPQLRTRTEEEGER